MLALQYGPEVVRPSRLVVKNCPSASVDLDPICDHRFSFADGDGGAARGYRRAS